MKELRDATIYIIKKYNHILEIIEKSEKEPKLLLREKLFDNEFDLNFMLENIRNMFGAEGVEHFHTNFLHKVTQIIKEDIPYENIEFRIVPNQYLSYVLLLTACYQEDTYPILQVDPYLKKIEIPKNPQVISLSEEIKSFEKEIVKQTNYLKTLEMSKKNPIHFVGDNSLNLVKSLIHKKSFLQKLQDEEIKTTKQIQILQSEIYDRNSILEKINLSLMEVEMLAERYTERLMKYYDFQLYAESLSNNIIKPYQEIDESELDIVL